MKTGNKPHYYDALIERLNKTEIRYNVLCSNYGFLTIVCSDTNKNIVRGICKNIDIHEDDHRIVNHVI